ncbi:iron chelate uptake ABC transporter family permease subunit [Clostridium paraputrificum]|uniref:iron chelate uptake ABC transporter family permease subunit n=1 Tax=Clostridium TaxID=1485 RepID=UPI003D340A41
MQLRREEKIKKQIWLLFVIALVAAILFVVIGLTPKNAEYLISKRVPKIIAIIISGGAVAFSSIIFQTISNNRILTPSVLGLDAVYSFFQTVVVFIFGSSSILMTNKNLNFLVSLVGMLLISSLLYLIVFKKKSTSIMYLLLVGLIVGTLFNSMTSFLQVLIDPNEYLSLQAKLIASFNNVNTDIIFIAILILLLMIPFIYDELKLLDVMSLGKEQAINLGVNYDKVMKKLLVVVAILTAMSTALVGPITFLGLIVVNVTYQLIKSFKHKYLITASILISISSLIIGLIIVERIFEFNTTLSVIINFVGGLYFLYLLLKESKL